MRRAIFAILVLCSLIIIALAASQGPNNPGTVVDDSGVGTVTWTNPGNAASADDTYATASLAAGATSHYLKATNFGFSVPSGSTINGITMSFDRHRDQTGTGIRDDDIRLVKGGVVSGSGRGDPNNDWPTADAYRTAGSSSDLWGLSLVPDDVNASNFGVVISARETGNVQSDIAYIDHVRITVNYTPPTGLPRRVVVSRLAGGISEARGP